MKWSDYAIATPVVAHAPRAAAVRLEALGTPLADALSHTIIEWHKSGKIVELESQWGLQPSDWTRQMVEKCKSGDASCDAERDGS